MATIAQLRYSPLARHPPHFSLRHRLLPNSPFPGNATVPFNLSPCPLHSTNRSKPFLVPGIQFSYGSGAGAGTGGANGGLGGPGGGSGGSSGDDDSNDPRSLSDSFGPIGAFVNGWRSRVAADPEFPFKVLMEELVGVSACALGDMASRPNFGLNELDFVFSTLVVGSIVNFVLMYLLAPTVSASASTHSLPSFFANCPTSHMFEPGPYGVLDRFGTFVYKGTVFAAVGFAAGLVGTAISNGLIKMRKKMDPSFETPNNPPPTVLNAVTWAIHMGVSSNLRYQTLNGVEFLLAKGLPPFIFKTSVVILRCLNNVLGGMSFVILARLTGSQSIVDQGKVLLAEDEEGSSSSSRTTIQKPQNLANEADDDLLQISNNGSSSLSK